MITPNTTGSSEPHAAAASPSLSPLTDVHSFWSKRWSSPKLGWHLEDINPHLKKYATILFDENNDEGDDVRINNDAGSRIFVPLCGKSIDLAYLTDHPKVSHVVGIDIVRNAAEEFARDYPHFSIEEVQFCDGADNDGQATTSGECTTDTDNEQKQQQNTIQKRNSFHGKGISILNGDLFDFLSMSNDDRTSYILDKNPYCNTNKPAADNKHLKHKTGHYLFDSIYDRASMVAIHPSLRHEYANLMGNILRPGGTMLLVTIERRTTTTDDAKVDGPPFSIDELQVRQLYDSQPWVESVTLLEEVDDLEKEEAKERWGKRGVLEMYELVFVIKAKMQA